MFILYFHEIFNVTVSFSVCSLKEAKYARKLHIVLFCLGEEKKTTTSIVMSYVFWSGQFTA